MDIFSAIAQSSHKMILDIVHGEPGILGSVNPSGVTPFLAAVYQGDRSLVETLLGTGYPFSLQEYAASGDIANLKRRLKDKNEDVNARTRDGWTALHLASLTGHAAVVELLIQCGADVNARSLGETAGATPLHSAAMGAHFEAARVLADAGADVNCAMDGSLVTPLHLAAAGPDTALVRFLAERGADPFARNSSGRTPLDIAVENGRRETADYLREWQSS